MPFLVALVSYFLPSWHHKCPVSKGAERCLWEKVFGLQMSSWLYLVISAADQVDRQTFLSNISYEVLLRFFKGNPGKSSSVICV